MNVNEITSNFFYRGSSVKKCYIDNSVVSLGGDARVDMELDALSGEIQNEPERLQKSGRLLLIVKGTIRSPSNELIKVDFELQVEGEFSSPQEVSDQQFVNMLWVNGTSALYGIARGKMEAISSLIFHQGKISFPLINVMEFLKEKSENSKNQIDKQKES